MTSPALFDETDDTGLPLTPREDVPRASGLAATLEENLCALVDRAEHEPGDTVSEELVRRVLLADRGDHVVIGGPNPPLYRSQGRLRRFVVHEKELEELLGDVRDGDDVFLFGISLGEEVAYLLRTRPDANLVVWDRDPWLVRLALTRQDYRKALSTGRLRIAMGADIVDHLPTLHERRVVFHPTFRTIYKDEMTLVSEAISGTAPSDGRRWVALGMGGTPVRYIASALRQEGFSVMPLELQRWHPDEVGIAIEKLRPERVVTVNYSATVATSCGALDIPLYVWEVDPTTDRMPSPPEDSESGAIQMFTLREDHVADLRAAGFENVSYLPLGVDVEIRAPARTNAPGEPDYASPVTFVGSSLVKRAERFRRLFLQLYASFDCCGDESFEETEQRLDEVLRAERADYSRYVTNELLEEHFGEFLEAARRSGTPDDPRKWVAEIVASQKRVTYVSALAEERVQIWGDEGWGTVA
ncbi:MAG: DUF3880 domain-containing protein, partial [Planctomycetota bacterium]